MTLYDLAGLAGALMILGAYAALQLKRLDAHRWPALTLNFCGASLVAISLLPRFALGAFLVEVAWALIALFGLIRLMAKRAPRD